MSRLTLLLFALCAVKVLTISRPKRTVAEAKAAVLEWDGGSGGGARVIRAAKKKHRSTSSSGEGKRQSSDDKKDSLDMAISDSSSSEDSKRAANKYKPVSTEERHGWRKWHRKCYRCPIEEKKKWRDPTIKWICGGYQRARRSFKSECMMYYRNCQDGTMFVKIHDHRCGNSSSSDPQPRGHHFFYDYKVLLSQESSKSSSGSDSSDTSSPESSD